MNVDTRDAPAQVFIRPAMEHRWGMRVDLDHPVQLAVGGKTFATGTLRNASISGALIETEARCPALTPLTVNIHGRRAGKLLELPLAANVARAEPGAVAVEWRDMACEPLVTLLQEAQSDAQLWARDPAFT